MRIGIDLGGTKIECIRAVKRTCDGDPAGVQAEFGEARERGLDGQGAARDHRNNFV